MTNVDLIATLWLPIIKVTVLFSAVKNQYIFLFYLLLLLLHSITYFFKKGCPISIQYSPKFTFQYFLVMTTVDSMHFVKIKYKSLVRIRRIVAVEKFSWARWRIEVSGISATLSRNAALPVLSNSKNLKRSTENWPHFINNSYRLSPFR